MNILKKSEKYSPSRQGVSFAVIGVKAIRLAALGRLTHEA